MFSLVRQEVLKLIWYGIIAMLLKLLTVLSSLCQEPQLSEFLGDHSSTFILVEKYANKTIHLQWPEINRIRLLYSTWCYTNQKPSISPALPPHPAQTHTLAYSWD